MSFIFEIVSEGDGRGFNRSATDDKASVKWAGRWGDLYQSKKHPVTWRVRKMLKKVAK